MEDPESEKASDEEEEEVAAADVEVRELFVERLPAAVVVGWGGKSSVDRPNCLSNGFPETWRGVLGVASKVPSSWCCWW